MRKFWQQYWQAISGVIASVVLIAGGLFIQHVTDKPTVSDRPTRATAGSATYRAAITQVELSNLYAGTVTIQPTGQSGQADVQNAGTDQGDLKLVTTVRNNKLIVRQTGDCVRPGVTAACTASFTLSIPADADLKVTGNGAKLVLARLSGDLDIRNSGDITVAAASGNLKLHSDQGVVSASELQSRAVTATNRNGAITLGFATAPDTVSAIADSGDVSVTVPSTAAYKVDATAPTGTKRITAKTTDSADHTVKVQSGNGSVTVSN